MKKIITSVITSLILGVTAQANGSTKYINIGANQATVNTQSGTGFEIGYGVAKVFNNNIMTGVDFNYGIAKIDDGTVSNYGMDAKLGYRYKDISVFGIGSLIVQSYVDTEAYGFGFGSGIEYTPFEHVGIGADYKSYTMTNEFTDYDFETLKVYVKIRY